MPRSEVQEMGEQPGGRSSGRSVIGRRSWLRRAFARVASASCVTGAMPRPPVSAQDSKADPARAAENDQAADLEVREVEEQASRVGIGPLSLVKSSHYQVIGNASPAFMRQILKDCELLAADYLDHFRARGFDVRLPGRRLTAVVFIDERPFNKFFPEAAQAKVVGGYSRSKNWIVLFDWRNVPQRSRSGIANMTTLAHEAMHQLCFNTGLLSRQADPPLCVVEGLGMYAEARKMTGRSDLGRINRSRLDNLAHILRRRKWISVKELLTIDQSMLDSDSDLVELFYAESWLLVDYLMRGPARLPLFREYLAAISTRVDRSHRIEDAEAHFGNLDRLDRDLRAQLVRLQTGR